MPSRSLLVLFALVALLAAVQADSPYICETYDPLTRTCSYTKSDFVPTSSSYQGYKTCRITNLPTDLQQTVDTLFPEGKHPDPLMIRPDVFGYVTEAHTNISFTFVSTGAGNKNRLGYAKFNMLTNAPVADSLVFAFPRINTLDGGCLRQGDTYTFGEFAVGDMIVFFLDSNSNSADRFWSYINDEWHNPDTDECDCTTGYVHGSWAYLTDDDITLFGFEDLKLGDADYNDVMFFLTYEGGLDYNEIPPFENGTLRICNVDTQVSERSYALVNCTQWGILESTAEQSCLTYMKIPEGWIWALDSDPDAKSIIPQLANTQWGYTQATCFLLSTNATAGVGYSASGAICNPNTYSIKTLYNATSNLYCYNAACTSRFVLKGANLGTDCSATSVCSLTTDGAILALSPTSSTGVVQYPSVYSVYLRTGDGSQDLATTLQIPTGPKQIDLFVLLDIGGATTNGLLGSVATSFKNIPTTFGTTNYDLKLGLAVYKGGAASSSTITSTWSLTSSTTAINDMGDTISSSTAPNCGTNRGLFDAITYAMADGRAINWRESSAYKVLWVVTNCDQSTTNGAAMRAATINRGVRVIFMSPSENEPGFMDDNSESYYPPYLVRYTATTSGGGNWHNDPFRSSNSNGGRGAYRIGPMWDDVSPYTDSTPNWITGLPTTTQTVDSALLTYPLEYTATWPSGFTPVSGTSYSQVIRLIGRTTTTININYNHAPVVQSLTFPVTGGDSRTINLAPTDEDGNIMFITFTSLPNPAQGVLTRADNGAAVVLNTPVPAGVYTFVFTASASASGSSTFAFRVSDGCATATGTVTMNIAFANTAPVATDFSINMNEDSDWDDVVNNGQVNFAPHISDVDGQTLNVYVTSLASSLGSLRTWDSGSAGTVVSLGQQVANLTRFVLNNPSGYGSVSFNYKVNDGFLDSNTAKVTINVNHVNHDPVLSIPVRSYKVLQDSTGWFSITGTITDSDGTYAADPDQVTLMAIASDFTTYDIQVGSLTMTKSPLPTAGTPFLFFASPYSSTPAGSNSFPISGLQWNHQAGSGLQTVTLQARDKHGAVSNSIPLTFDVTLYNPPTWVVTPVLTHTTDQGVRVTGLSFSATDIDYDVPTDDWKDLIFTLQSKSDNCDIFLQPVSTGAEISLAEGGSFQKSTQANYVELIGATTNTSGFTIDYEPHDDFFGTDQFTFTVHDSHDLYAAQVITVTIEVTREDTPPESADSIIRGNEQQLTSTRIPLYSTNAPGVNPVRLELLTTNFAGFLYLDAGSTRWWSGNPNTALTTNSDVQIWARGNLNVYHPTLPVGNFTYRVTEPGTLDNSIGPTYTGQIYLDHVNLPPTSSSVSYTIRKGDLLKVTLPASDPNQDDPSNTIKALIKSIVPGSKGTFYLDEAATTEMDTAFITGGGDIGVARTFWYRSDTDHSSPQSAPLARFTFIVVDKQGEPSVSTYSGSIIVTYAGTPPEFLGELEVTTNQETPVPMVLNVVETESGGPATATLTTLPDRGTLAACDNNGVCTDVPNPLPVGGFEIPSSNGRVVFRPRAFDWDDDFANFDFTLTDSLSGATGPFTMKIHVIHINKRPFIQAMNFLTTAETNQGIIVNESSSHSFSWRAWDQDSLPSTLQTQLRVSFYTTQGFTLYQCTGAVADWLDSAVCTFDASVPFAERADFTKNAKKTIGLYSTTTTACADFNTLKLRYGGVTRDCETQFKFNFVPTPGASYTPYVSINFVAVDDYEAESTPISATIWVKAVNTPPTIYSPPLVLGTQGITNPFIRNTDQNSPQYNNPVIVGDEDANGNQELLTISVNAGFSGNLIWPSNAPCAVDPDNSQVWYCKDRIASFNQWLGDLRFEVTSGEQADLTFVINDLGWTSDWKPSPNLTASSQTTVKIVAAIGVPKGNSSTLAIAVGVAAAAGLLLLGALGFFLRKAVAPPKDDYFSAATTPLSAAPQSPLYQAQNVTHENPLFKGAS